MTNDLYPLTTITCNVNATSLTRGGGGCTTQKILWGCRPALQICQCWWGKKFIVNKLPKLPNVRSSEKHTLFQTKMVNIYAVFRPKPLKKKPYPLGPHIPILPISGSTSSEAPSLVRARCAKSCGPVALEASSATSFARDGRQSLSPETR